MKKMSLSGRFSATFLVLLVFMIGVVSALEFDNTYEYNPTSKTAYIHNCDFWLGWCWSEGEVLAEASLVWGDTKVGNGIDTHVGTFNYTPKSVNAEIQDLDLVDLKNDQVMTRGKQYKVLTYIEDDKYIQDCSNGIWNEDLLGYENCTLVENGTYLKEEWRPLQSWLLQNDFIVDETYEIGVFVDTQEGDYGDWLPTFSGLQIEEWSTWTAGLNTDLLVYYNFDETSGTTAIDGTGNQNGTITGGVTINQTGKLGQAYDFDGNDDWVDITGISSTTTDYTWSMWIKSSTNTLGFLFDNQDDRCAIGLSDTDTTYFFCAAGSAQEIGANMLDGSWHLYTYVLDGTNARFYRDGVSISNSSAPTNTNLGDSGGTAIANRYDGGANGYDGLIDEFGLWERALTSAEVTQLYNSGSGITYTDDFSSDNAPTITTPLPANATNYTTTTTVTFNATVTDDINLENVSLVIDGTIDQTNSSGINNSLYTFSKSLSAGTHYWHFSAYDNASQETTSENRTVYISVVPPSITLYSPVDEYNTTSIYGDGFVAYVTDNVAVKNVSLYVDSVLEDTDTSGVNGTNYTLNTTVLNGSVDWYIKACDNQDLCTDSATRTLNVNTDPNLKFNGQSGINESNYSGAIPINVTWDTTYAPGVMDIYYYFDGVFSGQASSSPGGSPYTQNAFGGSSGTALYYAEVTSSTVGLVRTDNYTAYIDVDAPTINITGQDVNSYISDGDNVTFNWTVSDNYAGVSVCWYNYNSTNTTLTCNDNTTTFQYAGGQSSFIFYSNDTLGNLASTTTTIDYDIAEEAYSYTDSVLEGTTQNYHLNISTTDSITAASLYYDGTAYASSILSLGGNSYKITNDILVPGVVSDENKTFYWTLTATAAGDVNTTSFNQTVLAFGIDNCSANSVLLYNFTVYDEKQQTQLNGATDKTDGRVHLQLYETTANALVGEYFEFYNETNPFTVCLENTISATDEYTIDLEVLYTADGYAQEFYYISQDSLTDDDLATNISLYLLDNDTAESFKIVYKDESFLAVEGVLQLLRKYTEEGVFKVVEQPKIDSSGEAIMQVELEDAVYTINIIVDNAIDATFNDVRFYCPNPAIDDCEEVLNKFESYSDVTDFSTINDLSFSVAYNATSRVISTPFSVLSGASRTIGLNVSLYDAFGNVSVCDDALTSSAGTLSCTVPNSFGNATVIAEIYDSGSQIGQSVVRLDGFGQEQFGLSIVVIAVISLLLLIMIGLTPGEPVLYGIFLIVGLIVLTALNLVFSTSWVGAGATFLWFIIAVGIILFKGGNR